MLEFTLQMPAPSAFDEAAFEGPLLSALRANSPALALTLINKVRERTPRDTGALREDETAEPYTGAVTGVRVVNLVKLYTAEDAQLTEWKRVYVAYQEGPPLGKSTYTNGPHQMFARVASEDIGDIADWAEATLDQAVSDLVDAFPIELYGTEG